MVGEFHKHNENDKIWWAVDIEQIGVGPYFSFDKKKIYDRSKDYPDSLSEEEKRIFDSENPDYAEYYRDFWEGRNLDKYRVNKN